VSCRLKIKPLWKHGGELPSYKTRFGALVNKLAERMSKTLTNSFPRVETKDTLQRL
jgi:hypothetical protein